MDELRLYIKEESRAINSDLMFLKDYNELVKINKEKSLKVATSSFYNYKKTYDCLDKMFKLLDQKKEMVLRKSIIVQTLRRLGVDNKRLLISYYLKRKSYEEISESSKLSPRTIARNIASVTNSYFKEKQFVEKTLKNL